MIIDPFDQVFDVVVVGTGYAGWAAARSARRQYAHVLLVGERGDLLWESGRAFCPHTGDAEDPDWRSLDAEVAARCGHDGPGLDGAIAEVIGTELLQESDVAVLYYAMPVAVTDRHGLVESLLVATKSGLRRITGRRWIDATETGMITRLVDPAAVARSPSSAEIHLYLQRADWGTIDDDHDHDGHGGLHATGWPTERRLSVPVPPDDAAWRLGLPDILDGLAERWGDDAASVIMSHVSFEPVPSYGGSARPRYDGPANVVPANPAFTSLEVRTLADRFRLGARAAAAIGAVPSADPDGALPLDSGVAIEPARTVTTDVCVAGAGTGGAVAALAAARAGSKIICVEPASFVGGIGTGGGIHTYSFGVPGGLQAEVDRATRALMSRFGKGLLGDGPFNPWAKMIMLERLLRAGGVDLRLGSVLYDVEVRDGRITAALIAGVEGVTRIEAAAYVDGTGDGDLGALAGADYTLGRRHDGLTHAYSQSSGRLRDLHGRPRMAVVNFDAGFCDPTDPVDLTRARLTGIRQYLLPGYDNGNRPTYLAPAIGLRQGRQIVTEYVMSLDDQISWREFEDVIGYTASHYENHASDCEFESDESLFWVWANRQWTTPIGCDLNYRMLVPRGLRNVWLGSRCAGVSQDAHHATRMQRDVQRLGEAAGFAAAIAAQDRDGAVRYPELRRRLDGTGALDRKPRRIEPAFGRIGTGQAHLAALPDAVARERALDLLDSGVPGEAMWWLCRHRELADDEIRARLVDPGRSPMVSWLAAGVAAMWGDSTAEPRLVQAIRNREYGFDDPDWRPGGYNAPRPGEPVDPLGWGYVVPHWLCAVGLLRRCGTAGCLDALADLLDQPVHGLNTVTTAALTLAELVRDDRIDAVDHHRVERMIDRIESARIVGTIDNPRRHTGRHSERALRGKADDLSTDPPATPRDNAVEDNSWQVPYVVEIVRRALGRPPSERLRAGLRDERALVRAAFSRIGAADPAASGQGWARSQERTAAVARTSSSL